MAAIDSASYDLAQATNLENLVPGDSLVKENSSLPASSKLSTQHPSADLLAGASAPNVEDPRWPLLNKWSSNSPFSSSTALKNNSSTPSIKTGPSKDPPHTTQVSSISPSIEEIPPPDVVVPVTSSLGAWEKPLSFCSTKSMQTSDFHQQNGSKLSLWPELANGKNGRSSNFVLSHDPISDSEKANIAALSKDYPWAAKMNQSFRNLHRVTILEYMEDGTPKVRIPSHVLLSGVENQKEFVVGQFYRCSAPSRGQIQAVVTRIWGRKCSIFNRKLGESNYLFHIPDESTRKWVLQRGLWHVDDCLMFVSPWSTNDVISVPEIKTVPVWLTLNNIPDQLYSFLGIKWIASGIGEPMLTEKPWLDPTQMGKAKILVEVKLDKPFPQRVALIDKSDTITMVDVLYSWLPSTCSSCGLLGHKASRCLLKSSKSIATFASNISDIPTDSSKFKENGKDLVVGLLPIIEVQGLEEVNTPITAPIQTGPVNAPQLLASSSSIPSAAPSMAIGSSTNSKENLSSNERALAINNNAVLANPMSIITKEVSPPTFQVERPIHRSCSSASLRNNRFSFLESTEDEEEPADLDIDPEHGGFLTPAGKRILRERPVKPSAKVKEMLWNHVASGRGNRGRGNRGGRG